MSFPQLPSALFLKHLTKFWFQPYWTVSTISALNWNLVDILRTAICTIFLFAFGDINVTEDYATNGKHISPFVFNCTLNSSLQNLNWRSSNVYSVNVSFLRGLRYNCFNAFLWKYVRFGHIWQEKANKSYPLQKNLQSIWVDYHFLMLYKSALKNLYENVLIPRHL